MSAKSVTAGLPGGEDANSGDRITGSEEWADRPMSDSRLLASNFPRAQSPREPEQARFRAASLHNERRKSPLNLGLYTSCRCRFPDSSLYLLLASHRRSGQLRVPAYFGYSVSLCSEPKNSSNLKNWHAWRRKIRSAITRSR